MNDAECTARMLSILHNDFRYKKDIQNNIVHFRNLPQSYILPYSHNSYRSRKRRKISYFFTNIYLFFF